MKKDKNVLIMTCLEENALPPCFRTKRNLIYRTLFHTLSIDNVVTALILSLAV